MKSELCCVNCGKLVSELDYITYESEDYGDCIYMCIVLKEG